MHLKKRDNTLFIAQWQRLPYVDITPWGRELQLGNRYTPLQITVAYHPYCGLCAHTHETLDKLYQVHKDLLNIKMRFTCTPGETDPCTTAVTAILGKAAGNQEQVAAMLADWFKWMNLEKWQYKWGADSETAITELLKKHASWIAAAHIKDTPAIFINGYWLPSKYRPKDLFQLLPALVPQAVVMQEHNALQQALLR
jgi:protein-disulfide isomerase